MSFRGELLGDVEAGLAFRVGNYVAYVNITGVRLRNLTPLHMSSVSV